MGFVKKKVAFWSAGVAQLALFLNLKVPVISIAGSIRTKRGRAYGGSSASALAKREWKNLNDVGPIVVGKYLYIVIIC